MSEDYIIREERKNAKFGGEGKSRTLTVPGFKGRRGGQKRAAGASGPAPQAVSLNRRAIRGEGGVGVSYVIRGGQVALLEIVERFKVA